MSNLAPNEEKSAHSERAATRSSALLADRSTRHKARVLMKERNRGMLTAATGDDST